MNGLSLDAGALIALERGDERVRALLRVAVERSLPLHVVAGVHAQTWRGGSRQARLARFLDSREVRIVSMDGMVARAIGVVCGAIGATDVVDVHVALDARAHRLAVVTSDPTDLGRIDPTLPVIVV